MGVSGANFIVGILLARYLGIEEFGRFSICWIVILFFSNIQYSLVTSPMLTIGPKKERSASVYYFGGAATIQILLIVCSSLLTWTLLMLVAVFRPSWSVNELALPLAATTAAFQAQEFLRRYFFTIDRGATAITVDVVRYAGQVLAIVWLFSTATLGVGEVFWATAIVSTLSTLVGLPLVGEIRWSKAKFLLATKRHWRFGKWTTGATFLQWTSSQFYYVVAASMFGATIVGALRASHNLLGFVNVIMLGIDNYVAPKASRAYESSGPKLALKFIRQLSALFAVPVILTTVGIIIYAPEILEFVFGQEYREYSVLLTWIGMSYIIMYLRLPLRTILRMFEETRGMFHASLSATLISLIGFYPLVQALGWSGLGVGLLLSQLVAVSTLVLAVTASIRAIESTRTVP